MTRLASRGSWPGIGVLPTLLALALAFSATAQAQPAADQAFPYYRVDQALHGLHAWYLAPQAGSFARDAQDLLAESRHHCATQGQGDGLKTAWRRALLSWARVSTPALGPVIERRSQRQIDFWPVRPALLAQAQARAPQTLDDMERVGAPAKGFPALEWLLSRPFAASHCPYVERVAEGIDAEARALLDGFEGLAGRDWAEAEDQARSAFDEWINQWVGGLERLRWIHIEQPLKRAAAAGHGRRPVFARQTVSDQQADWRAQWQALYAQARLPAEARTQPPQPGEALIPIEALLMGKGRIELARRWAAALDTADEAFRTLPATADARGLMALSRKLKAVGVLYQTEVATALDVRLGFSDADGD